MTKRLFTCWASASLFALGVLVIVTGFSTAFASSDQGFTGQWYGEGNDSTVGSSFIDVQFDQMGGYAIFHVPGIGLNHQFLPAEYEAGDVTVTIPGMDTTLTGSIDGDYISGLIWYTGFGFPLKVGDWQLFRALEAPPELGFGPGPTCDVSIPIYCTGDAEHCAEIVLFEPDIGPGYSRYFPDFRSHARRDVMMLTKYAAATTKCRTEHWTYWNFKSLGLGDMSEADGSTPGTSLGTPFHPPGTHEYGADVDVAYYQLYSSDNLLRPVCSSFEGYLLEASHCVDLPYGLDPWRTALFIATLSEHPLLRVVYVDWMVGPVLENALDELVSLGWIDAEHRTEIPLAYYVEGDDEPEYLFHHHHMHVGMNHLWDILTMIDITPDALNRRSQGKFVTAHIELLAGLGASEIDLSTVMLIVDGHTIVPALQTHAEVADHNANGIPDLAVKFDRKLVTETIGTGTVEVAITGSIYGYFFQGTDTLKVE